MNLEEFQIKVGYFIDDVHQGFGWIDDDRIEIEQQFNNYSGKSLSDDRYQILYNALKERDLLYDFDKGLKRYKELFKEGKTSETCEEMETIQNKLSGLFNASEFETGFPWLITEEDN